MMKQRSSERIEMLNSSGEPISLFDLSNGGACCFHEEKKGKGETVEVSIKDLSLKARVVYCQQRTDGYRLGLRFVDVPEDKQKMLTSLVDRFSRGVPLECQIEDDTSNEKD